MGLYFVCSHCSCRQGPTWKAVQHHFVSYGSQAAQLEITHMYMARLFHLFSLPSLSRMHGAAATKGSAGWEQTQLPGSTNLNATVPLRVWVGRSGNKWVAQWRRRWRLRRGKLQDADLLALDTLRTRAGQVGGFAALFLGPLGGTETEAGRSGSTLFGCQILGSVLGPQTLP